MALSSTTHWQLRTDGDDTNGGGCKAEQSGSLLASDASDPTKVAAAAYTFVSGDVGKTLYITEGSAGWTLGKYTINSVAAGVATLSGPVGGTSLARGVWVMMAGTDYTDQAGPQLSLTDLACNNNTTLTSVTGGFTAVMVGNLIQIASGTNFTVGFYQVSAYTDANTVTLDRNPTTGAAASGGGGKLGGALLTPGKALGTGAAVANHTVWIKDGTYTITSGLSVAMTNGTIQGFSTARGDATAAAIITSATNSVNLITVGAAYVTFKNLKLTHTASTRGYGITAGSVADVNGVRLTNCVIDGCAVGINGDYVTAYGFPNLVVDRCEIMNCVSYGIGCHSCIIRDCYIHDNGSDGWRRGVHTNNGFVAVIDSVIANNATNAINWNYDVYGTLLVSRSVLRGKAGSSHGITLTNTSANLALLLSNTVIELNGAYGISAAAAPLQIAQENLAFRANTSGNRNGSVIPTRASDVLLTTDPWTAAASGDYSPNTTAGGGALLRNAGHPGVSLFGTGYADIGPLRHQDPVGGGGGATPGLGFQSLLIRVLGGGGMSYKPNDFIAEEFITSSATGAAANADSLPTAALVKNGIDDGAVTLTVANVDAGRYKITGTIPSGYAAGDKLQIAVSATIGGVAAKAIVPIGVLDSKRNADLNDFNPVAATVNANVTQWRGTNVATTNVNGVPVVDLGYITGQAASTSTGPIDANVTQWSGVAIATPDTAGYPKVTIKSGTGIGEIGLASGAVSNVATTANLTNAPTAGDFTNTMKASITAAATAATPTAAAVTGAVGSVAAPVTIGANNDKAGYSLSGADHNAIAADVWNAARSSYNAAGSFGQGVAGVQGNVTGSVSNVTAPVTVGANNDKAGYKLASDGLDTISVADPGIPSQHTTVPRMMVALWRRAFKKTSLTASQLKMYADDDLTVTSTQAVADDGTAQTMGAAT